MAEGQEIKIEDDGMEIGGLTETPTLTITISGDIGSGKSIAAGIIRSSLNNPGFGENGQFAKPARILIQTKLVHE